MELSIVNSQSLILWFSNISGTKSKWVALLLFVLLYPILNEVIYAYGALIVIPVILFALNGKKMALIMAILTIPIISILQVVFVGTGVLASITNLIFPAVLMLFIGWTISSYIEVLQEKDQLIKELEGKQAEIEQLQDLIPICMYCKDVQMDDGYWTKVENYFSDISEIKFTHGICDNCYGRMEEEFN